MKSLFFNICLVLLLSFGFVSLGKAEVYNLELARMIIIGESVGDEVFIQPFADGEIGDVSILKDTYLTPPRAQGSLRIESDESYIIRSMSFDAWFRGANQPVLDDRVTTLDYAPNGALYEVFSLWDNYNYVITFLRRAPPGEGYDPAIIFMIEQRLCDLGDRIEIFDPLIGCEVEDISSRIVYVDYRYKD